MIKQTLKSNGFFNAAKGLKKYTLEDANGYLVATVNQKTKDADIHEVLWYGGDKHGKSSLTDGGIDGLMEFVGEAA